MFTFVQVHRHPRIQLIQNMIVGHSMVRGHVHTRHSSIVASPLGKTSAPTREVALLHKRIMTVEDKSRSCRSWGKVW